MEDKDVRAIVSEMLNPVIDDVKELKSEISSNKVWQSKYGEKIDNIEKSIGGMQDDIKALVSKPQKRWDSLVAALIASVVTAVVTYFIK